MNVPYAGQVKADLVVQVYFGNWLRDYSQAVDVGTVKNVSAEAIRVVLWILGFMSFGYGTKEFEVTTERLGCYRPEEHIDNPKDYADNEDARDYDRRLRGPVDERRELAIDPEVGLKAYIASENLGIDTSAGLVRRLFGRCIQLGRGYARNKNKADLYEALRLLGTACHCLEDFSAHSNYTELALIEMGERDIFPHVGRNCKIRLRGARSPVYPLVTGTFGGVDFLHSVTGEFDDKVTQSEIQELEGTLQNAQSQGADSSVLQDLLSKIPDGVFGGKDEAGKADELKQNATQHQMQHTRITPRQPEAWLQYVNDTQQQIYPILEWHDEVMQGITETIEKIPILPDLIENIQEQINIFVFSLIAPFMLPIINQIKNELNAGSSMIIQSSVDKQHIVFRDDDSSDPTHSMLSKDHFSNILNEPAGKIASQVLKWVVPQIIAAWDDERVDVDRTLNRIIRGVFHHPALREGGDDGAADGRRLMFGVVENWWREKSEREKDSLRDQLSRDGVEEGRNHKPGVVDHGHGSAKPLGMPNVYTAEHQGAPGGLGMLASAGFAGTPSDNRATQQFGQMAGEAVGGGALGSLVGGLASAVGGGVLASAMGGDEQPQTYSRTTYGDDGSRTQTTTQYGGRPGSGNYGQSQYSRTDDRHGGRSEQYSSYEQRSTGGYGSESRYEQQQSSYSGGYSSESRRYESTTTSSYNRREEESSGYGSNTYGEGRNTYGQSEVSGGYGSQSFGRRDDNDNERPSYGRRRDDDDNERSSYGRRHDNDDDDNRRSHGRRDSDDNQRGNYGRRGSDENRGGYSRQEESGYGQSTYGGRQQEESYGSSGGYGRNERSDEYGSGGYGQQTSGYGEERSEGYGSRRRGSNDDNEMPGGFGGGDEDDERRRGEYGRSDEYGSGGGYGGYRRRDDEY